MQIIKHGKRKSDALQGECQFCGCVVKCTKKETKTLPYSPATIDRDAQEGCATQYVKCPECKEDYLWVK